MCGRGRAGVRQERTAQYGGRMFVFAAMQGVQGVLRYPLGPSMSITSQHSSQRSAGPSIVKAVVLKKGKASCLQSFMG